MKTVFSENKLRKLIYKCQNFNFDNFLIIELKKYYFLDKMDAVEKIVLNFSSFN